MSYAPTYLSADSASGRAEASAVPSMQLLDFWLPIALFAFALIAAEHSTFYATPGFKDSTPGPISRWKSVVVVCFANWDTCRWVQLAAAFLLVRPPQKLSVNWKLLVMTLCGLGWLLLSMVWAADSGLSLSTRWCR